MCESAARNSGSSRRRRRGRRRRCRRRWRGRRRRGRRRRRRRRSTGHIPHSGAAASPGGAGEEEGLVSVCTTGATLLPAQVGWKASTWPARGLLSPPPPPAGSSSNHRHAATTHLRDWAATGDCQQTPPCRCFIQLFQISAHLRQDGGEGVDRQ